MRRGDKTDSSVWANVLTSVFRIEQTCQACGKRLLFLRGLGLSWGGGIGGGGRSMSGGFPVMWPVACKQDIVSPSPNVLSREYFPVEASISIHLRWGQLSLCSSVRAFPWQRPVLLGPSGQPCLHRYLMSDRQQWWVDLCLWQQAKDARLAVSSDLHWGVSAPRPSSQTRLLHGERCLSLSKHKNRGHKITAMQLSLYISFLPQNCVQKKEKWCLEIVKSSSSVPLVGCLMHVHHLVHDTTDYYMVEKSEHFPAHRTMLIVTYKFKGWVTLERLHMHDSDKENRLKQKAFKIFYERVFKSSNTTRGRTASCAFNTATPLQRESLLLHLIL